MVRFGRPSAGDGRTPRPNEPLSARGGTGLAFFASGLTGLAITAFALARLRPGPQRDPDLVAQSH